MSTPPTETPIPVPAPAPPPRRRSWLGLAWRAALALLLLAGLLGAWATWVVRQPYRAFRQPVLVDFPPGTPTRTIAATLEKLGVLEKGWYLYAARALRPRAKLQAGEYQFAAPASAEQVLDRLARGDIHYLELRIPEGANMFDIAAAAESLGLLKADDFLKVARDPSLIRDLDPLAPSLEGYLFPAVYRVTRRTTALQLAREMTARFRRAWKEIAAPNVDVHFVTTLASLVEKETAVSAERTLVAAVFSNRLRQNIKLDCDPTTIYAALLEGKWRGAIYRSDLDRQHPYNTYQQLGLPPGPIANPGAESLAAALHPAETGYLFFVASADGSGRHRFSTNIADHQRAVEAYRRRAREK